MASVGGRKHSLPSLETVRVLHVDDEPDFADVAGRLLEREDGRLTVRTARSAEDGLDALTESDFDCVVSDYDMPGRNGIEFLEDLRAEYPDLPFILFTGQGNEEVASRAISAGVTDYLRKQSSTNQYELLANRIVKAVEASHAERARRRHLRAIETAQEGISIIAEDGTYTYVNEAYADLYGYEPEGMIGEPYEITYPEGSLEVLQADVVPAVEERGYWHGETTGLRSDGSTFVEDHTLAKTRDGEMVCSVRDKSVQKAHERAIEGLHSTVRALMEAESVDEVGETVVSAVESVVGVSTTIAYRYDEETDALEPLAWSEGAPDRIGGVEPIDRGDALAREVFEAGERRVLDDDEMVLQRPFSDVPVAGEVVLPLGEYGVLLVGTADGNVLDGTDVALVQTLAAHATTALDGIRSERELREQREFVDQAIEALDDVFCVLDTEGTLQRWNERLVEVSGYDGGTIRATDGAPLFPDEHEERFDAAFEETMENGSATFESAVCTADGERIPYEFAGSRLTDADGNVTGVVRVGRDISRRKEYERKLERQNERLGEFASVISHDLRNPLNVAEGRLELAMAERDSEHLQAIAEAHERMETLIDDILAVSRSGKTALEPEPVRLESLVDECWAHVETHDATLVCESDLTVEADRTHLQQLVENCIRNAVEHAGTDVTLRIGDLDGGFYVEDDGDGIPEPDRERIFEPGYSTTEDGTGFGLDIVAGVIDAHDWAIAVTESDDGGARFEVTGVETGQ